MSQEGSREWPTQQEMEWMDSHPETFLPQTMDELCDWMSDPSTGKSWTLARLAEYLCDRGQWQKLRRLCFDKDHLCRMIGIKSLADALEARLGWTVQLSEMIQPRGQHHQHPINSDSCEPQTYSYIVVRVLVPSKEQSPSESQYRLWLFDSERNALIVHRGILCFLRVLQSLSSPSTASDRTPDNKIQLVSINSDVLPCALPVADSVDPSKVVYQQGGWSNGGGYTGNVSLWRVCKNQPDTSVTGGLRLKRIARSDESPSATTAIFIPQKLLKFCITYSFGELGPIPETKSRSASSRPAWSDNYLRHSNLMWNTIFQPGWRVRPQTVVALACNTLPVRSSSEASQIRRWFHDAWQFLYQSSSDQHASSNNHDPNAYQPTFEKRPSSGTGSTMEDATSLATHCLLTETLARSRGDMLICIEKQPQPGNHFLVMRNRALAVNMTPSLLSASMSVSNNLEEALWPQSELLAKGYKDAEIRAGEVISYPCPLAISSSSSDPQLQSHKSQWGVERYLCWSDPRDPRQGQYAVFMIRDHLKSWKLWNIRLVATIQGSQEMLDLGGMVEASELRDYFLHEKRRGQYGAYEKTCFIVPERCTQAPHWRSFCHFDGMRDWITERFEESCQSQLQRTL